MTALLRWTLSSLFTYPYLMFPVEWWVLWRRCPVLKLCTCYCKVCSSPFQRPSFWVFWRIILVLFYATDRNCHLLVTSTGECELTLHAVVLRWWESEGVEGSCVTCFSAAGLEADVPPWAELLREIQPSEPLPPPLPPSLRVKSVLARDDGICCDMYT